MRRLLVALPVGVVLCACGASSKRDMNMPPREVTYADACNLQDYFDQRHNAGLVPPKAEDEMTATNAKGQTIGEGSYVLRDPLSRRRFARMLREEYSGVEPKLLTAVESGDKPVVVKVRWWDAGPIRRLRPTDDVVVRTGLGETELPPNICVSDMLFGDQVYAMRARYLKNEVELATGKPMTAPAPSDTPPAPTSAAAPSPAPSGSSATP